MDCVAENGSGSRFRDRRWTACCLLKSETINWKKVTWQKKRAMYAPPKNLVRLSFGGSKYMKFICFFLFWCTYRASCTVYFDVRTVHLVQFILMYVPCILYSLFWCAYRASCTVYFDVRTVHLVQFILMYVPCILYSLLSAQTYVQHIYV